jgi:hypothetical protein
VDVIERLVKEYNIKLVEAIAVVDSLSKSLIRSINKKAVMPATGKDKIILSNGKDKIILSNGKDKIIIISNI